MIQHPKKLEAFNRRLDSRDNLSYRESLAIFESLHREAVMLKGIHPDNMLDGIEVDLRIAKAINRVGSCSKRSSEK